MEEKSFKPFISADRVLPEITPVSIGLGIMLAVLFGAANAYLGLRVGMTVSASIPAAVLSMGIVRIILKGIRFSKTTWFRQSALQVNLLPQVQSLQFRPCSCGQAKVMLFQSRHFG
ncbi:OPT/YSL family transporter [Treponema sp.]|uniref:OPT/YSL family transporter n=1 Tax=Treponema sp. TaxID=166 RepID=UPI0025E555CE|nr:OPT/YSL family transporter [Treponema sp.]